MTDNPNISPAPDEQNVPVMVWLRQIRDELSALYYKDPVAYIEETNRIGREFLERHSSKKGQ